MEFDMIGKVYEESVGKSQQKGKEIEKTRGELFTECLKRKKSGGSIWNANKNRRQVEIEQRARKQRYDEYVKMLRASSLKRKLEELETDKRFAQDSVARDVALSAYGVEFLKKYSGFF